MAKSSRRRSARGARGVAPAARARAPEPHGDRRRQLLEVAAKLIESEGPDAVRMPRVAALAGCARTLVYHYFPRREDLLAGVVARFYEQLDARTSAEARAHGIAALADPDAERAWRRSRPLLEATWDAMDGIGLGGLALARSELASARRSGRRASEATRELERRWFRPLRARGLSDAACAVALDCATALTHALLVQHRAGGLSRDEALALGFRALHALVLSLRGGSGAARRDA